MKKINTLFLEQSYKDCIEYLQDCIRSNRYESWDYIVLTASNPNQAKNYELQIEKRLKANVIDNRCKYVVVPDYNGERIGSGGATLNVLAVLKNEYNVDFEKCKILLIHSGGDSKRVPQYSVCGKLFSPIQKMLTSTMASTLFDELIATTSIMPSRMSNGIMVMSGDVMLLFNPLQVDFNNGGISAVSMKKNVQTGKNHGVFLLNDNGELLEFLHKNTVEDLTKKGAVDDFDNVNIDTGIILFDGSFANKMFGMISDENVVDDNKIKKYISAKVRLSFYGDFLYPFSKNATFEEYLKQTPEGEFCDELLEFRHLYWDMFKDDIMNVISVSPAEFLHFGTTREQLNLVTKELEDYKYLDWRKQVFTDSDGEKCAVYHSREDGSTFGDNCYLENSICLDSNLGNNVVLSYVALDNITVPNNVVLSGLKLEDGKFVVRIYGVNDDPKKSINDKTFMGVSISEVLANASYDIKQVASDENIWNTRLFPKCNTMEEAVQSALIVYDIFVKKNFSNFEIWANAEKVSLATSFNQADVEWINSWQNEINKQIIVGKAIDMLRNKNKVEDFIALFENLDFSNYMIDIITCIGENNNMMLMRLYWFAGQLAADIKTKELYEKKAFTYIAQSCECKANILRHKFIKESVEITLPARVNWGGGWTDTPPYCLENGGTVLNCAIKICKNNPIKAYVRKLDEKKIVLKSLDSNVTEIYCNKSLILDCGNPFGSVALQKACLVAMGIIQKEDDEDLANVYDILGGGLELSTAVENIPRGSGLGTSSILAGACVKAIYELMGISYTDEMVYNNVLQIEQLMSTGGGWQDQIGGITSGVKMITSNKGEQVLSVKHLNLSEDTIKELKDRFVIIYTGQRRLARNLLRDIVAGYINGQENVVTALSNIENLACIMQRQLEKGDIEAFADALNQHWEELKFLNDGCTNTCINYIFECSQDLLSGMMICGAGGGGFLQAVLKKGITKADLQKRIEKVFGNSGVKVWDSELLF